MSLYPSLEDMKVDQLGKIQAQMMTDIVNHQRTSQVSASLPYPLHPPDSSQSSLAHLYPSLGDYMGLELTEEVIAANMPEYLAVIHCQTDTPASTLSSVPILSSEFVAPLSGSSLGLVKSQISHGIREVTVCKDCDGKIGLRVQAINKGIFISLVKKHSPASLCGLRFGDQILQINGVNVAGYSVDKVNSILKKCPVNDISIAVRDRPFERTVTLHKDSAGHVGFQFRDGQICALVKDSSAARNGLLTEHCLLEVNGQNVVGLKDKDITNIIQECGQIITVTIMPNFIYKHMIKQMAPSLLTKVMDHSIPDV